MAENCFARFPGDMSSRSASAQIGAVDEDSEARGEIEAAAGDVEREGDVVGKSANLDSSQMRSHEEGEAALESGESDAPIVALDSGQPAHAEIDAHRIAHAQFRSWSDRCVRGRGRGQLHKSSDSAKGAVPIFAFD